MTPADLAALAIYRGHKMCACPDCERARQILKERDGRRWHTQTAATTNRDASGAT